MNNEQVLLDVSDLEMNGFEFILTSGVTVTFPAVDGAVRYRVYTRKELARIEALEQQAHDMRIAFNKRKKQKRARTGRRS